MNERDEATVRREDVKAQLAGKIGADGFARVGSASGSRAMVEGSRRARRKCSCGCGTRSSHVGLGDGVALMGGCEMRVRRWVRDGSGA